MTYHEVHKVVTTNEKVRCFALFNVGEASAWVQLDPKVFADLLVDLNESMGNDEEDYVFDIQTQEASGEWLHLYLYS